MTNQHPIPSITLTHEEVQLILSLLKAPPLLGMMADPAQGSSEELVRYRLLYAGRSLRARGVARMVTEDGEQRLKVREELLYLVATASQPKTSIIFTHVPQGEEQGEMIFGHLNGERIVRRHSPEPALHHFEQLADIDHLVEDFIGVAGLPEVTLIQHNGFHIESSRLNEVRRLIRDGADIDAAVTSIAELTSPEIAAAFVKTLSGRYTYSQMQIIRTLSGKQQIVQPLTLIAQNGSAWLSVQPSDPDESGRYFIRPVAFEDGVRYVLDLLALPLADQPLGNQG